MSQKIYEGIRGEQGCKVTVIHPDGRVTELDPCLDIRRHSPTGLEWGHLGLARLKEAQFQT